MLESHPSYAADYQDNLLPGVDLGLVKEAFDAGDGGELKWRRSAPPKMAAAYSSSALAVNAFGPWATHLDALSILQLGPFVGMAFEQKCPHGLQGRNPPNLDVLLLAEDRVVAIEAKCTEYLSPKTAKFADRYERLVPHRFEPGWLSVYEMLKEDPKHFKHLDAAQLVKHYLGLTWTYPAHPIELIYLYWEPFNAADYLAFQAHRDEIEAFAEMLAGSRVAFQGCSYRVLWREWEERMAELPWLSEHLTNLRNRYSVMI